MYADWGYGDVGWRNDGPGWTKTPNLEALRKDGIELLQYYTNPICSPSRATIQTGRYTIRTGRTSSAQAPSELAFASVFILYTVTWGLFPFLNDTRNILYVCPSPQLQKFGVSHQNTTLPSFYRNSAWLLLGHNGNGAATN